MTRELYHPVIGTFVEYADEYVDWLEEGNEISYHSGNTMYKLRKIEDQDILYVHGQGHIPLDVDEDVPELELDEVDDLLEYLGDTEEDIDADEPEPLSRLYDNLND